MVVLSRTALILLVLAALLLLPAPVRAVGVLPQTAPCHAAAVAALTKRGAFYSQGGALPSDPIDPATGTYYPRLGPNSFDCSGIIHWAYAQAGVAVGTTTYQLITNGVPIPCRLTDLNGAQTTCWAPGDLIFLRYSGGQHVALYVGNGLFFDCYSHGVGCIVHNVTTDPFYVRHFAQARRIVGGCEGMTLNPGVPSIAPAAGPALEQISDLLIPIRLQLPWQCGACTVETVTPITPLPDPKVQWYDLGSWVNWLGAQLWNRVAYPLICWMLAVAQGVLDNLQYLTNAIGVNGLNALWRLLVLLIVWLREMFLAVWQQAEGAYRVLWLLYGAVQQNTTQALGVITLVQALMNLFTSIIAQLTDLLLSIAHALAYLAALLFAVGPAVVTAVLNPTPPPQLAGLDQNILLQLLKDTLQGIADSKLGWVWVAFIALCYARFALWLLDEAATLNG